MQGINDNNNNNDSNDNNQFRALGDANINPSLLLQGNNNNNDNNEFNEVIFEAFYFYLILLY